MTHQKESYSTIHSSKEFFNSRKFSLVSEKITLPNGVHTEIAFVRHPGSSVIVPLFEDGIVGLIKQYRHPVNDYIFEIPAGTMKPGENPQDCAKRELEEEIGYVAGQIIGLGWTYLLPAYSSERSYVYIAKDLTKTSQKLDHDEIIQVYNFSMPEIVDMIDQDKIVDALSILAIYRAMRYLNPS
jgi:ADP-ribose pyrophosphatase